MNAALDGNECYDIAQAHKKNKKKQKKHTTVNVRRNQS